VIYATILAIPNYRLQATDKTVMTFRERPVGQPEALRAWFYPGHNWGEEFVYPKAKALEIAKATNTTVLYTPAEITPEVTTPIKSAAEPVVVELKQAPVMAIKPTGEEIQITEAVTAPPAEVLVAQNRARWDQLLIRRGLAALERAEKLSGALGPYALQASIAACHARARSADETDWVRILALYDALSQVAPSPVVELNRAVVLAIVDGPATGLELIDELTSEPSLKAYHLLPSVRGDLLAKLGRHDEACEEFKRAAMLTQNARERKLLLDRAAAENHKDTKNTKKI